MRAAEDGPARTVHESGNQANRAKLTQSSKCSHAETELFCTALQVFGLMANFLKNRTRQQVKSKHLCPSKQTLCDLERSQTSQIEQSLEIASLIVLIRIISALKARHRVIR